MEKLMRMNQEMESYLDTIQFLNEGTEDYFFIWDIRKSWFYVAGDIHRKYPLPHRGREGFSLQEWKEIIYPRDLKNVEKQLLVFMREEREIYNAEYRLVDREGNADWISCRGKVRYDEDGHQSFMLGRLSSSVLVRKADALTGLLNAERFVEDLQMCSEQGHSGYLLILGIDNFKHINIKYGRSYGNHILKKVTEVLEECVEISMNIYRLDGDRFAVMLPELSRGQVGELYKSIQGKLREYCTISAGAVYCNGDTSKDSSIMYQYGEDALDRAKKQGKDTLVFFSQDNYKKRFETIGLQEELYDSIHKNFEGFFLCYQPLVDSQTFEIRGAEALLRYVSPNRGKIGPTEFIPLLEQNELICQVGEWVLETALEQCRKWREQIPDFHINVNISYVQLRKEGISMRILEILKESGLPGSALTLEVTESMQLQDYQYFNRIFSRWKEAGIKIAIDDFGTGYSSLSYLKSIEIDETKVDRCFVSSVQNSAYNYRLLRNVIELAHSARILVCCEGVETEGELMALKELKPDILQGYLFAKPCIREEFEKIYMQKGSSNYNQRLKKEERLRGLDCGEDEQFMEILKKDELGNIVEGMDDIIYVSNIDTYELYYMNPAGRKLTGLYGYKGCKCYKVLMDRDTPCEFCAASRQESENFHVREIENSFLNRHFIVKDKVMPWQGQMVRLEIATDVTAREIASRKVKEKLDFEKIIVKCSRTLVEESDSGTAIVKVLGALGEFYQADRVYIFELEEEVDNWKNTYEWCRDESLSRKDYRQNLSGKMIEHWVKAFRKNAAVLVPDVNDLKDSFYEQWKKPGDVEVKRLMETPLWKDGHMIGFLGVDNPGCRQGEESLMNTMAYFLGDRISRDADKERLNELLDCRYEDILKNTDMGLWVILIDPEQERYEMYTDKTMRRILGIEGNPNPEECYRHWYSRIEPEEYAYINSGVENMIQSGKIVVVKYKWQHPTQGEVHIRCVGIRGKDCDGKISLEGYHSIVDERKIFQKVYTAT